MSGCAKKFCSMSEARVHRWLSGHAYLRRSWIQHEIDKKNGVLPYPPLLSPPHGVNNFHKELAPPSSSSGTRINPAVLIIIIVILAVVFFISGILHVLVRFLTKHPSSPSPSRYPDISNSDVLQRQLQQLFHLHDSGLDQAFIDALPVFKYRKISGLKEPFDCAVCLCEFSEKDKLRLLPVCSHAFHINCIDTWLLSNSTCPLCRGTLFTPGFSIENPIFDYDDTREEDCFACNGENRYTTGQKTMEIESVVKQGVFPVTLGKFRRLNDGASYAGGETSSSTLDARRCYSMGSHQYVVGDTNLMVALSNERKSRDARNATRTEHNGSPSADSEVDEKKISIRTKTDSYSVSKIWLWSKNSQSTSSSQT